LSKKEMIILFHGKDSYRIKEKIDEFVKAYKEKNKNYFGLNYLNGKEITLFDLKEEMLSYSMFSEKKLIIVNNLLSNQKNKEDFLSQIDLFKKSENILILVEENEVLGKIIDDFDKVNKFDLLNGLKLKDWIKKKVVSLESEIEEEAINKIIEYVGGDLWQINNELMKLSSYSKKITSDNVSKMVRPKNEINIFDTLDAVAQKNKKKAISLLRIHVDKGDSPIFLLSMIASQIRNIISVKNGAVVKQMNPFVYRKSVSQAKNFTMEDLKKIYSRILELDFEIKMGKINPDISLDVLISEI